MKIHQLIVIGSSAGGIEALITLVGALPQDFVAPICIAQHLPSGEHSTLPAILTRSGKLAACYPPEGMRLQGGVIFLAPPGHNLSLSGECVVVAPAVQQRSSPSIDLLFESAASSYRSRLIGLILTGNLTDGTAGMQAVKHMGGTTIIQDPLEAAFPSMPQSAQDHCAIDYCLALAQIAALLQALTG